MKKKTLAVVIAVVVIIIAIAAGISLYQGAAPAIKEITIYTGGTGGVYFPLGSAYAEILTKNGISAKAVTSGASVANAKAIGDGTAQAALIQNDVAYYAYHGLYMFKDSKVANIRGFASLYPETIQFIVRADSPIRSLKDLAGKKVAIGAVGSGTAVCCEQILRAAEVWDSVVKVNQDFREASESLKLGQIDCATIVAGIPTPAVNEIATTTPVRLIPIPDDILNKLKGQGYIFYVRQVAPKETYNGMTEATPTVAVKAIIAVSADLPGDLVYKMAKILYDNLEELRRAHARAAHISLETALEGMSIPLHPGAAKYYQERGLSIPPEIKP